MEPRQLTAEKMRAICDGVEELRGQKPGRLVDARQMVKVFDMLLADIVWLEQALANDPAPEHEHKWATPVLEQDAHRRKDELRLCLILDTIFCAVPGCRITPEQVTVR